ncbi:hypothetical protein FACS1894151_07410 [Spirochaetia bacterium]|nr:hypothetical protein FACS1894151_07410 [Spirochaetia bacterium]
MQMIMNIAGGLVNVYMILIFIRIMLTWFSGSARISAPALLTGITDPYLNMFRGIRFLRMGAVDLSPIAGLALLSLAGTVFSYLGRGGALTAGFLLALLLSGVWSILSFALNFSIIILILRIIAFFTNRDVYGSFWRIIDLIAQPIMFQVGKVFFRKQIVSFQTRLITVTAVMVVLRIGLEIVVRFLTTLITRLPF